MLHYDIANKYLQVANKFDYNYHNYYYCNLKIKHTFISLIKLRQIVFDH